MRAYDRAVVPLRRIALLSFLFVVISGCTRQAEPVFVMSEELQALPESHQRQIKEVLTKFFGNPINPRLVIPVSEDMNELVDVFDPDRVKHGAAVFNRRCVGCHGITGDGNGEAAPYLQPKPRDYRKGIFKFTSTPYGAKPNHADLARVIRRGAKGTSMPAFPFLPDEDVRDVIDYVILLSYRGELERSVAQIAELDYDADEELDPFEFTDAMSRIHDSWQQAEYLGVLPVTAQPKYSDETILAGRKAFLSRGCSKCHGDNARGQTEWLNREYIAEQEAKPEAEREKINFDAWGEPAPAADLTAGMLHGGRRPIDIYRRIYTGINGTPMPAFNQALAAEPETIWHLVHYALSVVEHREVEGLDEITAPSANDQSGSPESEN
ncbi:MAG TPA: c-type cytochrome [Pirellulaceae bacterium]|nr:c-type cytochrome [Planctomycetales bacterium]MCA9170577.1 c-type cytochrome [Planctomycetales bacterium]MCB9940444.1 c-type cytochrome [Planctomycetaceae bacterium]HRX81182.1 c-type cytochrome [Pirellulaceae bacterium]